jgi:Uma2 family endonuclease
MNEIAIKRQLPRTTQAAEGLPRWRWTTAELERIAEMGAFTSEDRFELIGGKILPMSPKGRLQDVLREMLERSWRRLLPDALTIIAEPQFNLADDTYAVPDLIILPTSMKAYDLRGGDALLAVEVADASLAYDRDTKAATYARFGVREYWVINARTLETIVHLEPAENGYANVVTKPGNALLTPTLAPMLVVRLTDLDID